MTATVLVAIKIIVGGKEQHGLLPVLLQDFATGEFL